MSNINNSSVRAYDRDMIYLSLADESEANTIKTALENANINDLIEYDEAIADCEGMLDYAMELGQQEEIYFWRCQLQKTKTEKRMCVRAIKNR